MAYFLIGKYISFFFSLSVFKDACTLNQNQVINVQLRSKSLREREYTYEVLQHLATSILLCSKQILYHYPGLTLWCQVDEYTSSQTQIFPLPFQPPNYTKSILLQHIPIKTKDHSAQLTSRILMSLDVSSQNKRAIYNEHVISGATFWGVMTICINIMLNCFKRVAQTARQQAKNAGRTNHN